MIEAVVGKLTGLGLAAKIAAASGAVVLASTAMAATGQLPPPAQEHVAAVVAHVGVTLPADTSSGPTTDTTAHPANHGATVSTAAHDHSQDALCGNHGKAVSAVARGKTSCLDETTPTTPTPSAPGEPDEPTTTTEPANGPGKSDHHKPTSKPHKPAGPDDSTTTSTSVPA